MIFPVGFWSIEFYPRFAEEAKVWRHLALTTPEAIPRLYSVETVGEFGIIVTDVGVPLTEIFSALKPSSKDGRSPSTLNGYEEFFRRFKTLDDFNASDLPLPDWKLKNEDLGDVKASIFQSLQSTVLPALERANVIHRDLKVENLLFMPLSGRAVVCDFGARCGTYLYDVCKVI